MRNRLKRLLREAFRRSSGPHPASFDYVLMISPALSRKLKRPERGQDPAHPGPGADAGSPFWPWSRPPRGAAFAGLRVEPIAEIVANYEVKSKELVSIGQAAEKAGVSRQSLQYYLMVGSVGAYRGHADRTTVVRSQGHRADPTDQEAERQRLPLAGDPRSVHGRTSVEFDDLRCTIIG